MREYRRKGGIMKIPFLYWLKKCYRVAIIYMLILNSVTCYAEPIKLTASWYSIKSLKKEGTWKISKGRTANNEYFDETALTAASWDFPLNTRVKVTNIQAPNKSIEVVVTDRTARRFKGKRIDLSKEAFRRISDLDKGLCQVYVEEVK